MSSREKENVKEENESGGNGQRVLPFINRIYCVFFSFFARLDLFHQPGNEKKKGWVVKRVNQHPIFIHSFHFYARFL